MPVKRQFVPLDELRGNDITLICNGCVVVNWHGHIHRSHIVLKCILA